MEASPRRIDLATRDRRRQFEWFRSFAFPYFSLTAEVDVAPLARSVRNAGGSFTAHLVPVLARAANGLAPFRQRIRGERVVEHATVHPSCTVLLEDEVFAFCTVRYDQDVTAFVEAAERAIERSRQTPSIDDEPERDDYQFLTAIPWVAFTALAHPVPLMAGDSVPRIAWGRYRYDGERMPMPLSIQAHHGLIDGVHIGRFFAEVEQRLQDVGRWIDGRT